MFKHLIPNQNQLEWIWFICFLFRDKGDNSSNYILRVVIEVVLLDVGEDEVPGVGDELQGLVLDPVLVVWEVLPIVDNSSTFPGQDLVSKIYFTFELLIYNSAWSLGYTEAGHWLKKQLEYSIFKVIKYKICDEIRLN